MTDTPAAVTSRARVPTATPARYAKRLVAHLGRKVEVVTQAETSTLRIGTATGQIVVHHGSLTLLAAGGDEQAVTVVEHVLGSHLERFGQRDGLRVTWTRTTADEQLATGPRLHPRT